MKNIAIIGGGAAGFFSAIRAKETNPTANVKLFEKSSKVLSKVLLTGGGRCNLTNSFLEINSFKSVYPRGFKLMQSLFCKFDNIATYKWFENHGVKLFTQNDNRVFPYSENSQTIANCLIKTANTLGIKILVNHSLEEIINIDSKLELKFKNHQSDIFDKVIIATGGSSNPNRFIYLENLGHCVEKPIPSLFTFNITDKNLSKLMGTTVNSVILSLPTTKFRSTGSLLITHWGISGPSVLKLSSYAARYLFEKDYKFQVSINWLAETNIQVATSIYCNFITENKNKQIISANPFGISSRLWQYLVIRACINSFTRLQELNKKAINKLIETLTNDKYLVSSKSKWREEFVTCGGISLKDVDKNSLESKKCNGLYFAGEILDIDGVTGGFNLQAAWTTGYIAGSSI